MDLGPSVSPDVHCRQQLNVLPTGFEHIQESPGNQRDCDESAAKSGAVLTPPASVEALAAALLTLSPEERARLVALLLAGGRPGPPSPP
jgi:hypothetical protein